MGLKAKCLFGIFQKNCSSGVSHVNVRCLLITISSSNRAPDYPTGAWTCSFFQTWAYFVCLIPVLCWPYMIWFLGLRNFSWAIEATDTAENGADYITPAYDYPMWRWQPPIFMPCQLLSSMRIPIIFKLFANNAEHRPTVCQHCWTWPNYLPSLPNCLPPLSNTDQMFSSSAKDRSIVCQSLVTSISRLNPSSFLGFLFSFQNSVFLCFLFFTGGQLGALQLRVLEI